MVQSNEFEPLNVNSWRLRISYWLLSHFSSLRRWSIVALAATDAFLIGWAVISFMPVIRDPHLVSRTAAEVAAIRPVLPPRPLPVELGAAAVLGAGQAVEAVATMTNPNQSFVARAVRYVFVDGAGGTSTEGWTWLMPGETRYVAGLFTHPVSIVTLRVVGMRWGREIVAAPTVAPEFEAIEVRTEPAAAGQPARTFFTLQNRSPLGYRTVTVLAVAQAGSQPVGVARLQLRDVTAGQARRAAVTWYDELGEAPNVKLQFLTDPFDPANLLLDT